MSGRVYAFGPFLLDASQRLLLREGKPVPLRPKAVDTLLVLVRNAGRLVGKDELMKEVWPDAFVEEVNLAKNISVLRQALGKENGGGEYIATVPKRGYRFVASVQVRVSDGKAPRTETEPQSPAVVTPALDRNAVPILPPTPDGKLGTGRERRPWRRAILLMAVALAIGASWLWLSPIPPPTVLKITQITHFGRVAPASRLVTDGTRIYFEEVRGGRHTLAAVPVEGGEPVPLATPFPNTELYGISPDHSVLLVGSYPGGSGEWTLWMVPTTGGSPRRVGNVIGHNPAWSRDGQKIAYFYGSGLYVVKPDGSDRRQLATTEGRGWFSRWAPDGQALRFSTFGSEILSLSLWEVDAKGGNLHRLLAGWREPPAYYGDGESDGDWTQNYFVFRSTRAGMASIWAIAERSKFLRRSSRAPVQLMTTDSSLWSLLATKNKIFYPGDKEVRELARYDGRSKQFVPYLPGVRARDVDFSRDGQWVAYVVPTMQQNILWRSRVDGRDRQQLTFPPMHAWRPRWSPDGKQIAFGATVPGKREEIFLVPSGGGEPEPVTPLGLDSISPDWSAGGDLLFFSAPVPASRSTISGENGGMYQLDLKTKRLTVFPGAETLLYPCWSPDGRYLAAQARDGTLMLFDSRSRQWRELAHGTALRAPVKWSHDSKYAYSQDVEGSQPIFRVRISDRKIEPIVTFERILRADVRSYSLAAVAPDDSPVVSLVLSHSDIYALDLKFP
jgi:DNA-binding winged helix-turn-helix (wHTH) protein/Tol biopolymer transport system component